MNNKHLHIGTSGWSYKDWKGVFYDSSTSPRDYLSHYAKTFSTVEIDSTFYGIPRLSTVENWFNQTPDAFIFSPKAPQIITHEKRLQNCSEEWQTFISHLSVLKHKLGPLVLQFDYKFTAEQYFDILREFLKKYGSEHRLCVEIRNRDWHKPEFYEMLRKTKTALVLNDLYYMPRVRELTADFTYIRLLGNRKQIPDDFSHVRVKRDKDLDWWAEWIDRCRDKEIEVFVYSNNRYQGHAPATIRSLQDRIGGGRSAG